MSRSRARFLSLPLFAAVVGAVLPAQGALKPAGGVLARPPMPGGGGLVLRAAPLPGATRVVRGDDGRTVVWAEGSMGRLSAPTPEALLQLVERLGPALGLDKPREEVVVEWLRRDALGMRHALLRRTAGGWPLLDSDLALHFDRDGVLVVVNGRYLPSVELPAAGARLAAPQVAARALDSVRKRAQAGGAGARAGEARVVRDVVWPQPLRRAAEVAVAFAPHLQWRVFVDVETGAVLGTRAGIHADTAATGSGKDSFGQTRTLQLTHFTQQNLYGTLDTSTGGPRLMTINLQNATDYESGSIFGSGNKDSWSDTAAVDVHANLRLVHDYFKSKHQRSSYDGRGTDIYALVHYGYQYANAFWDPQSRVMVLGDGDGQMVGRLTRCLDVLGHELAHAVIEYTAGLVYEYQPGALNEHFADVFGVVIKQGAGLVSGDANSWLVGDRCMGSAAGRTFMRDMANPNRGDQPGHMNQYVQLANTEEEDYGGVHVNSGIPNRAAYLVGSQLGRDALGKAWYRVLAQGYISSRSQFIDLRRAALRSCQDLALDCAKIGSAFDTVGITDAGGGGSGGCPPNSTQQGDACYCNEGYQPDSTGTSCVPVQQGNCPPHSTSYGGQCYCDTGYEPDAAGQACVPATEAPCPANSHRAGTQCVCDDGYQGIPTQPPGCQPIPGQCPPNSRPAPSDPNACECLPGWVPNASRDGCVPGGSGCGNETFYGRCQGSVLVYCDNGTSIRQVDCAPLGKSCALVDATNGYDCVAAQTGCGDVPANGRCVGTLVQWCDKGETRQLECGPAHGCELSTELGRYWCSACPLHATMRDGEEGRACYCDEGWEKSEDGKSCVEAGGGGGGEEPDEGGGGDSGGRGRRSSSSLCATGGAGFAALLPLLPLVRRRRARV